MLPDRSDYLRCPVTDRPRLRSPVRGTGKLT
ncbi:methionine import ATP-binding protein metN [Streptomyces filamentosus NRRL 15998]|uniref:Methionine import ATP-binding protein metN n=1 Tax=Streptomyces filamentosus NRRL 15998 TaxID=457431 RepID=D6ARX1_STRFL|nr:methionine import ATP-binding protein metN [Streptomyces filamentosus NRRL 15998]